MFCRSSSASLPSTFAIFEFLNVPYLHVGWRSAAKSGHALSLFDAILRPPDLRPPSKDVSNLSE